MTTQYIKVAEDEGDEAIEIPCESDNTVLLTTLTSLFPGASGLKYRNAESGTMRGLRLIDAKLQAPEEGWPAISVYYCCFPKENKRKIEDQSNTPNAKTKRIEDGKRCSDLIVLGLPWKTTDKELKEYFENFGVLLMAQVKKDTRSGLSKGFGFVRFSNYDDQVKVITKRHCIDGRWCDVRIPMSRDGYGNESRNQEFNRKIFIGRLTEDITNDDLREYFIKYGEIADIFIPRPFRGFAFVTFKELDIAQSLCGEDHIIKGISVHVSNAVPKYEINNQSPAYNNKPSYARYGSNYDSSYPINSHVSNCSVPRQPPPPPANYSPPAPQYDYYSRPSHRTNQPNYHDTGNPYNRYGSYSSSDYSSYY